ncbi:hypothetical protein ACKRZS_005481 [Fusarium odoratissimum]
MELHVKRVLNPLIARSQLKISLWIFEFAVNASNPSKPQQIIATRGRPVRSMYANTFGASDCSANAANVRDAAYTAVFPTLISDIRITAFIISGKTSEPLISIAMTNGLAAASEPYLAPSNLGSLYGTSKPMSRIERM